ncbi:hypothetical protein ACWC5I_36475 [Kitasatospora sp. NPDC001574]
MSTTSPSPVSPADGGGLPGHPADTRLLPVLRTDQGIVQLRYDGPAMLRGLARADALAVVPPGGAAAGDLIELVEAP